MWPFRGPPLVERPDRQGAGPDRSGSGPCERPHKCQIRRLRLTRPRYGESLGFSIRRGKDTGAVVVVSRVALDTPAYRARLQPGDLIVAANGVSFRSVGYREALQILSSCKEVNLTVLSQRSTLISEYSVLDYMWVDRNGRPVSPPPTEHHLQRTSSYKDKATYKKVIVSVDQGLSLGLMIRGGAEYGLGIFITGVDEASAADLAGLQIGDQILSVNDVDFTTITHDDAVEQLQQSPHMSMVVRSLGKVPHSTIPYSSANSPVASTSGAWFGEPVQNRPELSRKGSSRKRDRNMEEPSGPIPNPDRAEMRLDRKAKKMLTENQRISLAYYCNEYETGAMPVDSFVTALLELLDTPEKYALMTEVRGIIREEDLDKFDELIYRREMQAMKTKEAMKLAVEIHAEHADERRTSPNEVMKGLSRRGSFRASSRRRQQQDVHHLTVPNENGPDSIHTPPSEDSGVDLANGTIFGHGSRKGSRVSTGSRESMLLDPQQVQRKPSPWRMSPRTARRYFDANFSLRDGNQDTRMRRATLRRHSSGGEGVNPEERRPRNRPHEDRRWSIGSEMVDGPYFGAHLDAAQAVLSRLESIALSRRHNSPRPSRMSPIPIPLSPNSLQVPHNRVRRHRSLPDPHAIQARKKQQQLERMQQHRSASVRIPGHRTIPEGEGKFRIIVKKTRPLLGIAIEGGCDTSQPLPRIISIHSSGAAFEAGGLKVGHIILEVDGIDLSRRPHSEVAQLIAHAFYNTDRDQVEFLVTETSKNTESEIRRTSIMIFE